MRVGQVLVRLDDAALQAVQDYAQAELAAAHSARLLAEKNALRLRNLYDQEAVSQQALATMLKRRLRAPRRRRSLPVKNCDMPRCSAPMADRFTAQWACGAQVGRCRRHGNARCTSLYR